MQHLLDKMGAIDFKFKKLKIKEDFNIFTILRNINDEVYLHSRFIYELLNPTGTHNQNDKFILLFLKSIGILNFSTNRLIVFREKFNIDILITNSQQAIIIENKVWSGDQPNQLYNYYSKMISNGYQNENIYIVYLSPEGTEPSEQNLNSLYNSAFIKKNLFFVSYKNEINNWLLECIKESALQPVLRETIIQYQKTINDMTGNTMDQNEKMEIIDLAKQQDNAFKIQKLADNWIHVKWHTEWEFWHELESEITKKYTILNLKKFSSDNIDSVIHGKRNKNPWYGLLFPIAQWDKTEVCLFIERGDSNLYYGLIMVDDNKIVSNKNFKPLINKLNSIWEWNGKQENDWLGGCLSKQKINFESFNSDDTLKLVNPTTRLEIIRNLWDEVQQFITNINNELSKPD